MSCCTRSSWAQILTSTNTYLGPLRDARAIGQQLHLTQSIAGPALSSSSAAGMLAFQQYTYAADAGSAVRCVTDAAIPTASIPGEVLLSVKATALNYGDAFLARGGARALFNLPLPIIIGRDVAGVVEAIADGTQTSLKVGDKVVGFVALGKGRGSFAAKCVVQEKHCAPLPDGVSFSDAAALPTAGCTTWMALRSNHVLQRGAKILILGGSSGTGIIAIQLARIAGCAEIATTSSQVDLCRSLGATIVVNHRNGEKWEEMLAGRDYDVIFDCIEGLGAWRKAPRVLKSRGSKFVSIIMDDAHADAAIVSMLLFVGRVLSRSLWGLFGYPSFYWIINTGSVVGLKELVGYVASGQLKVVLDGGTRTVDAAAFKSMMETQASGRAHGKLVMSWE